MSQFRPATLQLLTSAVLESTAWMAWQWHQPQGSQCRGASGIRQLAERMNERTKESICGESKTSHGWASPEVSVWSMPRPRAPSPGGLLGGCQGGPMQSAHNQGVVPHPGWDTPASCGRDGLTAARIPAVGLARAGLSSWILQPKRMVAGGRGDIPTSQALLWLSNIIPASCFTSLLPIFLMCYSVHLFIRSVTQPTVPKPFSRSCVQSGGRNRHTRSVQKESQFHLLNRLIVIRVSSSKNCLFHPSGWQSITVGHVPLVCVSTKSRSVQVGVHAWPLGKTWFAQTVFTEEH